MLPGRRLPMRRIALLVVLAALATADDASPPPLRALLVTGGGWHDYAKIAPLLTARISTWANVAWEVKWGLEPLKDPKLGDGFDVVVYDLCFTQGDDQQLIDNVLRVTRAGKPTVLRHCAMHCFRDVAGAHQAWAGCCGMDSTSHDAFHAITTAKADP